DEQLERVRELERDRRVGVLRREPLDDRPDPSLLRPDTLPCFANVAPRHRATVSKDMSVSSERRRPPLPHPHPPHPPPEGIGSTRAKAAGERVAEQGQVAAK